MSCHTSAVTHCCVSVHVPIVQSYIVQSSNYIYLIYVKYWYFSLPVDGGRVQAHDLHCAVIHSSVIKANYMFRSYVFVKDMGIG